MKKSLVVISSMLAVLLLLTVFAGSAAAALGGETFTVYVSTNPSGATATYVATGETITTPGSFVIHSGTQYYGVASQIVITKNGYYPYYATVKASDFNNDPPRKYIEGVTLEPISTTGTLTLTSSPSGAAVYIDGSYYGTTPLTVELSAGSHRVSMQKSGYDSWSSTVSISSGGSKTVTGNLEKIVNTGYLSISSSPSGATVFIDGSYRGITPASLTLNEGSHTVKLTASGYSEYTTSVYVAGGRTSVVTASMSPSVQLGYVNLKASPAGASIYVDGVYQATVPAVSGVTLGPFATGTAHTLLLTANGYQSGSTSFTLSAGETKTITMNLAAEQAKTANLYVSSSPTGAAIYLDNVYYGMTPATIPDITTGSHILKLQASGYAEWQEAVTLTAGQTLEKSVSMSPSVAPTVPARTPAPVFGLIAGLGAAAVLLFRRK